MSDSANCTYCIDDDMLQVMEKTGVLYTMMGLILGCASSIIFFTVIRHKVLRDKKQYILFSGYAFCNMVTSLAFTIYGPRLIWLIKTGRGKVWESKWDCFWRVGHHLTIWGYFPAHWMLVVFSVDRLLAVMTPLKYFKHCRARYALCMVGVVYAYTVFCIGLGVWSQYPYQEPEFPQVFCSGSQLHPTFYQFLLTDRSVAVVLSVSLYLPVIFFYWRAQAKVQPAVSNAQMKRDLKKQKKFTVSLGISCLCTFMLVILPTIGNLLSDLFTLSPDTRFMIVLVMAWLGNCDGMLDLFILLFRHEEFKLGIEFMFKCKELTEAKLDQPAKQLAKAKQKKAKEEQGDQGRDANERAKT